MAIVTRETITPREQQEMAYQREMTELAQNHARDMKAMEIEVAKLEARFSSWLKLPLLLVKLPVLCLLAVGFIVGSFRDDYEPGENFWSLLK